MKLYKKKSVVNILLYMSMMIGIYMLAKIMKRQKRELDWIRFLVKKNDSIIEVFNQWFIAKKQGKSIEEYLLKMQYNTIAIFGAGKIGCRLYEELKDSKIVVKYLIDRNAESLKVNYPVVKELKGEVDAVIVTAVGSFEEIQKQLKEEYDCNVIAIEDIIFQL